MSAISGAGGPGGPKDLLGALRDGRIQGEDERLRVATQLMEGQFYQVLFSAMRDTVPGDGLMSGGQGEEMFTDMLDQQLADHAAGNMDSGIGAALYRHFVGHLRGGNEGAPAEPVAEAGSDLRPGSGPGIGEVAE
jgi:Rod binding domain-containing protein